MARYRTYKNGITGHRLHGFYIIQGSEKGLFQIWNEDKTVFMKDIYDYEECEWIIEKETASPEIYEKMKELYSKDFVILTQMLIEMTQESNPNKDMYKLIQRVRYRKDNERKF